MSDGTRETGGGGNEEARKSYGVERRRRSESGYKRGVNEGWLGEGRETGRGMRETGG